MERFEFNDKVKVDIAGTVLTLKTDKTTIDKSIAFGKDIQKKATTLDKLEYEKGSNLICNECYKFIDKITEEGASKKIFSNRGKDPFDCLQVIKFLVEQMKENRVCSLEETSKNYSPNRAQRRNKKK